MLSKSYEAELNPGHQLQILLKELFPLDTNNTSFLFRIDNALLANGELTELVYNSTINYMVRRLITTAKFLKRKIEANGLSDGVLATNLRGFIENELNLPTNKTERVFTLLFECSKVSGRKPPPTKLKRIKNRARREGKELRCHICGIETNLVNENIDESATLEHIWPNSLGGASEDPNLVITCQKCNNNKKAYIEANDFHYEEICLSTDKDDDSFAVELNMGYKVALWAKSDYQCTRCGKPAVYMGTLQFSRRNTNDSWHFLNIDAYCQQHARE